MAKVWLADYECRADRPADELPDVCMVCGGEADDTVRREFRWHPSWMYVFLLLGVLPAVVLLLLLSKTMRVDCPVCDRHRGHWWQGNLLAAALVLGGFGALFAALVAASALDQPGRPNPLMPVAGIGGLVVLLVGLVAGVIVSNRLIRPVEITRDDVHLTNVSDEFVAAVKAKRRAERTRRNAPPD
jgi:hypothetical protein